jgi:hypothetical protein
VHAVRLARNDEMESGWTATGAFADRRKQRWRGRSLMRYD